MIKFVLLFTLLVFSQTAVAQNTMRNLDELIDTSGVGWKFVKLLVDSAANQVEILPCDSAKGKDALYHTQVTSHSPLGGVVYSTGGILVDHGWIRILGSGHPRLPRSLPDWNKGKSFTEFGEKPTYLLIADDAAGGFYAIDGGEFGGKPGIIWYLSPDTMEWGSLDLTYSQFLHFCFNNDLNEFYAGIRWKTWQQDVPKLSGSECFTFTPPLYTKEGKDIAKDDLKAVPVEEQYKESMIILKAIKGEK
jgi:hypothetical protein